MAEQRIPTIIITGKAIFKAFASFALVLLCYLAPLNSTAQFAPPLGDGANPPPAVPGDQGEPLPPPTGHAELTAGHNFPVDVGHNRATVFIHRQGARGDRMVQTIRGDQLGANELMQIERILGINFNSGLKTIKLVIDDQKLEQIQQVLFPYPKARINGDNKKIAHDQPAQGRPREGSSYRFEGQLPTVKAFCRFLVILGVVSATIWMALAAYSMILGHPYGGKRVIGTAAGLMLLLTGYTIWKIIQMNTFKATGNQASVSQNRPITAKVDDAEKQPITSSSVSGIISPHGGRPERSGLSVRPLIGN